ncbi:MAG: hypothetical protein FWF49_04675 [Oscillospiraceae bacterium]|nr:hypothetical protein [Oscillospiraceae bacterium]
MNEDTQKNCSYFYSAVCVCLSGRHGIARHSRTLSANPVFFTVPFAPAVFSVFIITKSHIGTYILCIASLIAVAISAIIDRTGPTLDLSNGTIGLLAFMNTSVYSSAVMNLGTALLGAAIFVFSFHKDNVKPLKIMTRCGAVFSLLFLIAAIMQWTRSLHYIYFIVILLPLLWYIYLIALSLYLFFKKDPRPDTSSTSIA